MEQNPRPEIHPLVALIDAEAKKRGMKRGPLCKAAGLSADFLRGVEKRGPGTSVNGRSLSKLAEYLNITPAELTQLMTTRTAAPAAPRDEVRKTFKSLNLAEAPRDIPVHGTSSGAISGGFSMTDDIIAYVRRPSSLVGIADVYAIYVVSESMRPLHRPGDLCFIHPGRPCIREDSVILQVQTSPGAAPETYIKTFVAIDAEWVTVKQYNPPSEIKYKRSTVLKMHHVMTVNELLGG